MNPLFLRYAQLALTALIIIFALSVIGTAGHSLNVYRIEKDSNPWWLPIWSQHFDPHGHEGLIAAGAVTFILDAAFMAVSFIPKFDSPHWRALASFATNLPSALITMATVIYAHILNNNSPELDTIQTWTCNFDSRESADMSYPIPSDQSNASFARLCTESKYALYTTLVIFLLQVVMMLLAVVTWATDMWTRHKAKKDDEKWQDASSLEMNVQNVHTKA